MANTSGKGTGTAGRNTGAAGKNTGGPRRLGPQQTPASKSSGAKRRQARSQKSRSSKLGWISVAVVVVVVVALIIIKVTSSGSTPSTATVDASGRNPAPAPAAMVKPVETVPASTYNSIGVAGQTAPFTVTKNQPVLTENSKPRFVYLGGEFCPYCAAMRWSLVAALSRFGTFSGLKETTSSPTDGNIPTFSFVGATYTSPYIVFSPYEQTDRQQNPLMTVPSDVQKLYTTYDGSGTSGTVFSPGGAGIPFLDIGNKYVSAGDPPYLSSFFNNDTGPLVNGGPGTLAIAQAVHDPTSAVGKAIGATGFTVMSDYLAGAICNVDGQKPASVCNSSGVQAAIKALAKVKPVS